MSNVQKTFIDYANLGDTGTNTAGSIQPLEDGERASADTLGRAAENIRSRTEIQRSAVEDLLYYRDRVAPYFITLASSGVLSWGVGGAGRVNNTTALTLRPMVGPRTNVKGLLTIGIAASNQLLYTVTSFGYAFLGMNAISVEHRDVTGTVTPVVTISAGPVYNILVVFDSANTGHDATTIAPLVATQIAGVAALSGYLTCTASAVPAVAISATSGKVYIDTRVHSGIGGRATADLEEHTLAANALNAFTTTNPLSEGDLLAIRYDYLIEPGSVSGDPKGGVPGGRAQSNASESNTDVSNNLFIAQDNPEFLPGCIPLCKVVGGRLVWVDGTSQNNNTSVEPGANFGTYINVGVFAGPATQVVNGGIDNGGDPVLQDVLVSIDQRLGQLRARTWVVTDGTNSTGGDYNDPAGVTSAISASTNGGTIVVRRGVYTTGVPTLSPSSGHVALEGETSDLTLTARTRVTVAADTTFTGRLALKDLAYLRATVARTQVIGELSLERVAWQAGTLRVLGARCHIVDSTMLPGAGVGAHSIGAFITDAADTYIANTNFSGPDPSTNTPVFVIGDGVDRATITRCQFTSNVASVAPLALQPGGERMEVLFDGCIFEGTAGSATLLDTTGVDFQGTITFRDCVFKGAAFSVLRLQHTTGTMVFERCVVEAQGSPNGLSTATQPVVVVNPGAAGVARIRGLEVKVNETNYTGQLRALVYIGCDEDLTSLPGRIDAEDVQINLVGASATGPLSSVVFIKREDATPNALRVANLSVNMSGKTQPDVTNTTEITAGPAYIIRATGYAPTTMNRNMLDLQDFSILNTNGPASDDLAGSRGGCLRLELCQLHGYRQTQVDTPNSNAFNRQSARQIEMYGATLTDADYPLELSGAAGWQMVVGRQVSEGINSKIARATVFCGVQNTVPVALLDGGSIVDTRIQVANTLAAPLVFFSGVTASGGRNRLVRCDIRTTDPTEFLSQAISSQNLEISNCYFVCGSTTGSVLSLAGSLGGLQLHGNTFITAGAIAADCTPNPTTVVATSATNISGNTFFTAALAVD